MNGCGDEAIATGTANAVKTAVAVATASAEAQACSSGGVAEALAESVATAIKK
jgi:hypothetical protein